jgi:glycerol kinase
VERYVLVVDQGSTSTRCLIYDEDLKQIAVAVQPVASNFLAEGLVEHDPEHLVAGVLAAIENAVLQAGIRWESISGLGLAAQTETFIVWDRRTGRAAHPAVSWRDSRAASLCEKLRSRGHEATIRLRTGLPLGSAFAAPKLRTLLDANPALRVKAKCGDLLFGDVNSWLIWKMSAGNAHLTDASMASRTMLYNLGEHRWDPELMQLFNVPGTMMPRVGPTIGKLAETDPVVCGFRLPIVVAIGDQQAGLFGQRCWSAGMVKLTLGTGAFLWANVGGQLPTTIPEGAVVSVAWDWPGERAYALEGFVPNAGSVVDWLRGIGILREGEWPTIRGDALRHPSPVWCVPALFGLGTPSWEPRHQAHLVGLTADSTADDIGEAALLGVAHQIADAIEALAQGGKYAMRLARVDGGLSANYSLLKAIADLTGLRLERSDEIEITARGTAMLAGLGLGWWSVSTLGGEHSSTTIEPSLRVSDSSRQESRNHWHKILDRTRLLTSDI